MIVPRLAEFFTIAILLASSSSAYAIKESSTQGRYVWGAEVNTFTPCRDKTYWVKASAEIQKKLTTQHGLLTSKPYQEVFISVAGKLHPKAEDGFAGDYPVCMRFSFCMMCAR